MDTCAVTVRLHCLSPRPLSLKRRDHPRHTTKGPNSTSQKDLRIRERDLRFDVSPSFQTVTDTERIVLPARSGLSVNQTLLARTPRVAFEHFTAHLITTSPANARSQSAQ